MFYSKPDITPLNLDLKELPVSEGSRNLYAQTTDRIHIGIRQSGQWLEVRTSPENGTNDFFQMENIVISKAISPYYIDEPDPKTYCDLLGLTVQGNTIQSEKIMGPNNIDLSGNRTYWKSTHIVKKNQGLTEFVDDIQDVFPDVTIIQSGKTALCSKTKAYKWERRIVDFIICEDTNFTLGFGKDKKEIRNILDNNPEDSSFLPFPFQFQISSQSRNDPSGVQFLEKNLNIHKKEYKYNTLELTEFGFSTSYRTEDKFSKKIMSGLNKIIQENFSFKVKYINLENSQVDSVIENETEGEPWISQDLMEWCRKSDTNYIRLKLKDDILIGSRPLSENTKRWSFFNPR